MTCDRASGRRRRRRCRGAPTAPGPAGRASARASQPAEPSSSENGTSSTPSASHVRRTRAAGRHDLEPGPQRARLDPAHRQQLADHPRQPVGLLGDDPEAPVRRVRRQLLRVAADARERRLEVVRDAAQEVVLRLVEARPGAGSGPRPARTAGRSGSPPTTSIANSSNRSWSARSQRRVAGRWPDDDAELLPGGDEVGADRAPGRRGRSPRWGSRAGRRAAARSRSSRTRPGAWSAARRTIASGRSRRLSTRARPRSGAARGCGAPRSRARRLWLSASRLNSSSPGSSRRPGSSPADTRSTDRAMARSGAPRSAASSAASRTANTTDDRDGEQQHARDGRVGVRRSRSRAGRRCRTPATGQHRGGDQAERQPGPEAEPGAAIDRRRVDAPLAVLGLRVVDRRQLGRSPGLGGAAAASAREIRSDRRPPSA